MKLYEDDIAPNCRRLRILLTEKGVEIESVKLSIMAADNLSDDYRKVNPFGMFPALELDDGTVLGESVAIARYFEDLYPDPPMFGTTAVEKALVEAWDRRSDFDLMLSVAEYFRNSAPLFENRAMPGWGDMAQIPEIVERGKRRVDVFMHQLDAQLEGKEFVTGDRFTNADCSATPDDCANVKRWFEAVSARPSAQAWPDMAAVMARMQAASE